MKPTLPLISQPLTSDELRRLLAQLAILSVNGNGKGNVKPPKEAVRS